MLALRSWITHLDIGASSSIGQGNDPIVEWPWMSSIFHSFWFHHANPRSPGAQTEIDCSLGQRRPPPVLWSHLLSLYGAGCNTGASSIGAVRSRWAEILSKQDGCPVSGRKSPRSRSNCYWLKKQKLNLLWYCMVNEPYNRWVRESWWHLVGSRESHNTSLTRTDAANSIRSSYLEWYQRSRVTHFFWVGSVTKRSSAICTVCLSLLLGVTSTPRRGLRVHHVFRVQTLTHAQTDGRKTTLALYIIDDFLASGRLTYGQTDARKYGPQALSA